ncbi:hypothetical protein D623_10021854 [Myotis brandtii]|uniref:Uncharacterized protein n=1 Tax=Myotis brandtii TaxID=109478 RepID=S7NB31_MYOBR|nr:hypothetical protein D623_10021854 [Myotis brandtii]
MPILGKDKPSQGPEEMGPEQGWPPYTLKHPKCMASEEQHVGIGPGGETLRVVPQQLPLYTPPSA